MTISFNRDKFFKNEGSSALYDLLMKVYGRLDNNYESQDDFEERLNEEIDNAFIYDRDQWNLMGCYQRPADADLSQAFEYLYEDCLTYFELIEDEDEDEEEEN